MRLRKLKLSGGANFSSAVAPAFYPVHADTKSGRHTNAVVFRGADNVDKSKYIKFAKSYIKYLWFEELNEFEGSEKIRSIRQSVIRGGEDFTVFYSYNPPRRVDMTSRLTINPINGIKSLLFPSSTIRTQRRCSRL
ncbi:MAG: phage terminase large subunit [Oscillospiraceae bacterium]|jgi:hypothetical protein|nr:phage terminase large subunit [Oscillospiraceae bacterium]